MQIEWKSNGMDSPLLRIAAQENHVAIAESLIRHGAKMEIGTVTSQTLLFIAARDNFYEILKLLVENGADVNAQVNSKVVSPLCIVLLKKNNLEMSLILLQSGVSLIDKDEKGNIAMELSLKWNRMEVFKTIAAFQK